jgi:hypothetical protein
MTLPPAYGSGAAAGGLTELDYIAIKHSSAGDDITVTSSNATYEWTGVNFQSDAANWTLNASDELVFSAIGGKFAIDWTLLFGGGGAPPTPYWVTSFLEIDEGSIGSWSFVTGSLCAAAIESDPGGGQSKITIHQRVVTSVAQGDSLRIRVRRGAGSGVTVTSDGGNGSNWNLLKLDD